MSPSRTTRPLVVLTSIVAVFTVAAVPADGQAILRGVVLEDGTETPLGTVDIRLIDPSGVTRVRGVSNPEGGFRIEVPDSGTYRIAVRRVGYAPVSTDSVPIADGDDVQIEVRLHRTVVPLQAVTVIARRPAVPGRIAEFRERAEWNKRAGIGRIYTREDIDRLEPYHAQAILDRTLWGPGCQPRILLDGLPFDGPMTMIPGDHVEGVEIYRGATQIPPEFYRNGMCGLAMVWSRYDPPGMRPFTWKRLAAATVIVALIGFLAQ